MTLSIYQYYRIHNIHAIPNNHSDEVSHLIKAEECPLHAIKKQEYLLPPSIGSAYFVEKYAFFHNLMSPECNFKGISANIHSVIHNFHRFFHNSSRGYV